VPRSKTVPSYLHHKPSGQARVRIDGKDHYLGLYGSPKSKAKYDLLVRKHLTAQTKAEVETRVQISNDLTINELIAAYLRHAKTYYVKHDRETPEYGNICAALKPIRLRHGHELVTAFGPLKLKAIRRDWIAAKLVRTQINARVGRVRRMFAWGVEEERIPSAVLDALKAIRGLRKDRTEAREGKKVVPVEDAHVEAVRPYVSRQVWAMVQLQRLTGMRPAEIRIMRTGDIKILTPTWEYRPGEHKEEHVEKDRLIYVGPRAQEVLKPWLRTELGAYLFQPREAEAERSAGKRAARKTPVQPSQQNRRKKRPRHAPSDRYTKDTYGQAIDRACDKAGIPRWSPNQLRHAAATRIRAEMGLEAAQVVLGHSKADVTQTYAERDTQLAKQAMEKLG
jgi:integrase